MLSRVPWIEELRREDFKKALGKIDLGGNWQIMSRFFADVIALTGRTLKSGFLTKPTFHSHGLNAASPHGAIPNTWSLNTVCCRRDTFRPNEFKRVVRLGWLAKLSTRNGRRQIMRRILKGRYVLTH